MDLSAARLKFRAISLLLSVTAVCGAQTQATLEEILPSGKVLRVLAVSQVKLPGHRTALMLTYQTNLKVTALRALRKEIDEIWPVFQGDVEKAKVTTAIINATEVPQGVMLKSTHAHYFMFSKVDSEWRLVSDADGR